MWRQFRNRILLILKTSHIFALFLQIKLLKYAKILHFFTTVSIKVIYVIKEIVHDKHQNVLKLGPRKLKKKITNLI